MHKRRQVAELSDALQHPFPTLCHQAGTGDIECADLVCCLQLLLPLLLLSHDDQAQSS